MTIADLNGNLYLLFQFDAAECGKLVSKETKVDILVTPIVTVLIGVGVASLIAASIGAAASAVGQAIMWATELRPFFMGIIVSAVIGIAGGLHAWGELHAHQHGTPAVSAVWPCFPGFRCAEQLYLCGQCCFYLWYRNFV